MARAVRVLTDSQFRTLEALVDTLIPADASGPGAVEAHAADFVEQALAQSSMLLADFVAGLESTDACAVSRQGVHYSQLGPDCRAAILSDIERGTASGFASSSAALFEVLRSLTLEGMFCEPAHGGNANHIGWRLIGYPGNKFVITPEDQALDVIPKPIYALEESD